MDLELLKHDPTIKAIFDLHNLFVDLEGGIPKCPSLCSLELTSDSGESLASAVARDFCKAFQAAHILDFTSVTPTHTKLPAVLQAPNQFTFEVKALGVSTIDHCQESQNATTSISLVQAPCAHCNGGAPAVTTDVLQCLRCHHEFTPKECKHVTQLKVASDNIHISIGHGHIKILCHQLPEFVFAECFCTPAVPATICPLVPLQNHLNVIGALPFLTHMMAQQLHRLWIAPSANKTWTSTHSSPMVCFSLTV